jgi:hypothetical protein
MVIAWVVLLAVATLSSANAAAEPSGPKLIVHASPGLEATAREIGAMEGIDLTESLRITGVGSLDPPVHVVVAGEHSELARNLPGWVAGYARGDRDAIVVFPSRVSSYPDRNLETLLRHELTHVLVWRATHGHPVPRWFDEGLATVAAREWGLEDRARFALAVVGTRARNTADLDRGFAGSSRDATRSYALSAAFMRYLMGRFGPDAPPRLLAQIGAGRSFDEAFVDVTGTPLDRVAWTFFVKDAFWNTWLPFLTSSGALWTGITLLALVAIRRRRQQRAAIRAAWQAEEEAQLAARQAKTSSMDYTIN